MPAQKGRRFSSGMHDADVRPLVVHLAQDAYPGARVLPEMGLMYGCVRVDVAAITPSCLHGYEIKADADTLKRLPMQVDQYSQALDRCTLVVGERHLAKALPLLPTWWGVLRVRQRDGGLHLEPEREAAPNPTPAVHATLHLLWRDELLVLLTEAGAAKGLRSAPKGRLFRRALDALPPDALRAQVRQVLATRTGWR